MKEKDPHDSKFNDDVCMRWFLDEINDYRKELQEYNGSHFQYVPPPDLLYFIDTLCRMSNARKKRFRKRWPRSRVRRNGWMLRESKVIMDSDAVEETAEKPQGDAAGDAANKEEELYEGA